MFLEDPPDHILIDLDTEDIGNLLGDLQAPKLWIATLHFEDGGDQLLRRSLGPRLPSAPGGIKQSVLTPDQDFMKPLEGRRPKDDRNLPSALR